MKSRPSKPAALTAWKLNPILPTPVRKVRALITRRATTSFGSRLLVYPQLLALASGALCAARTSRKFSSKKYFDFEGGVKLPPSLYFGKNFFSAESRNHHERKREKHPESDSSDGPAVARLGIRRQGVSGATR